MKSTACMHATCCLWSSNGSDLDSSPPRLTVTPEIHGTTIQLHKLVKPYRPQLAAMSHTEINTQKPMWPWPWPLTLTFNRVLEVVEVHVRAKFHQAKYKYSGSWVAVVTEKKNSDENNTVRRYRADSKN